MDEKKKMERWCEITWISNLEERESAHFRPLALIFSFSAPSTCAFAALQLRSSHKSSPTTFGFFLEKGPFFLLLSGNFFVITPYTYAVYRVPFIHNYHYSLVLKNATWILCNHFNVCSCALLVHSLILRWAECMKILLIWCEGKYLGCRVESVKSEFIQYSVKI